jgi:glycosyltransferase involved in cell wall biosynthesis
LPGVGLTDDVSNLSANLCNHLRTAGLHCYQNIVLKRERRGEALMKLSVVIPCFNAANTIAVQLEALAKQHWSEPWEVVVADNGSIDETVAIVKQYQEKLPNLRIVDSSDKRGAAHARNVGVMAAVSDAIAFCDADDEVAPGWVAAMGKALFKYDFVAGKCEYNKLNAPWVIKYCPHAQVDGLQAYIHPPYLPHAGSCSLGASRSAHEAIGGFDETMLQLEDTDYCWRMQLAGTQLHFVPDAVLHYRFRPTIKGFLKQAFLWGKYDVLLYKKYRPLGMPQVLWKEGVRVWWHLLKRLPHVLSEEYRIIWVRTFARRVGRLHGCIQYRVLAL